MSVQIKNFVDVVARARELECRVPVVIALLPGNFSTAANVGEFRYHPATPYIRSAWQTVNLHDEGPSGSGVGDLGTGLGDQGSGVRTPVPGPRSLTPLLSANVPLAVFFGADLLSDPGCRLLVALSMVSRVLIVDPRCASPREIVFDVVVERPGGNGHECIEYEGDAVGIVALVSEVREIWAGNMNREGTRV